MSTSLPSPGDTFAGVRLGERRRGSDDYAVHEGTDSLGLPVEVHLARTAALPVTFTVDDFLNRVRGATTVRHEALLPFITGGVETGIAFAVAKANDAPGLDEKLGRGGALDEERVLAIGLTVAEVLASLEAARLRHGNLTPRRVLLPGRGEVLVRPIRVVPPEVAPRRRRYQAPEEARGDLGDIRSDLFVLGLVMAEAMSGRHPIPGGGDQVARALYEGRLPALGSYLPDVGPGTKVAIRNLLAPDAKDRYPSAAVAARALRSVLHPGTVSAAPAAPVVPVYQSPPPPPSPGEAAPQTAPIDLGGPSSAAQPGSAIPVLGEPVPRAAGASQPVKRSPGRLFIRSRLGEAMLELDEHVHVGRPGGALDVQARQTAFDEAVFRVERSRTADVLHPLVDGVTVNGNSRPSYELQDGDAIEAPEISARYERKVRQALRAAGADGAPTRHPASLAVIGLTALLTAGVLAMGLLSTAGAKKAAKEPLALRNEAERALADARKRLGDQPVAPPDAGTSTDPPPGGNANANAPERERAARDLLEGARRWARNHPDDAEDGHTRLSEVADKFPDTAHAVLARIEAADLLRRARVQADAAVDSKIERAHEDAGEGMLDEALKELTRYADENPGTVSAERVRRVMIQLESVVRARYEADRATVLSAIEVRNWQVAEETVRAMLQYVPWSLKDQTLALQAQIEEARDELLRGGEVQPPGAGEGPPDGAVPPPGGGTPPPPVESRTPEDLEQAATALFRKARGKMGSNAHLEALDLFLAFLRDYKNTQTGAKYDLEVRERIKSLATGPAGVIRLFRGRVEEAKKGRYRISYDFEDDEQMLDWRDENAFDAPPRANWSIVSGAARAKGSGALVLDATFLLEFLSLEVKVTPLRAHDLGAAFFEVDEIQRYYLFTLQNSFFTLGLGPGAKPFRENAIVLFGRDMWRDTPPGELGYVRKNGSDVPKVQPGAPLTIKVAKAEDQVWMRFEGGRTIRGSANGDKPYVFKGLEPAVFVLNSEGFFDEIVVEGTPDPEWVAQRWRDRLSGL